MKIIKFIAISLTIITFVVFAYSYAHAAEDQFIVSQLIDDTPDLIAPSVPTDLSATAVSTSQIDLSWTASTDDTAVTDYRVFRDNNYIGLSGGATTYSDTGLTPNTAYTYTVSAIDAANNESARSASSTATTFDVPVSTPVGGGTTSGQQVITLLYLNVAPDFNEALISFGTNVPVRALVWWGKTQDFEVGSLASDLYKKDHVIRLTDLVPGTHYFFKIELVDGYERKRVIDNQDFYTLSLPDSNPPENVTNLKATEKNGNVLLTWRNPHTDFESVRIVKSPIFYPRDPSEGEVIYEGRAEEFTDRNVEPGKTYYYSAFAKDFVGNYSSGSVTDIRLSLDGTGSGSPQLFADILKLPSDLIDPLLKSLSIWDLNFIQDGVKKPIVSGTVEVRGDRSLTISIDYDKIPEILKTIAITMYDPEDKDKTFSFLLRVNKDKTAYEANLAAFERPGKYEFALAILDYKHQGLASLSGAIIAKIPDVFSEGDNRFNYLWFLLILLSALILVLAHRHRKQQMTQPENVVLQ